MRKQKIELIFCQWDLLLFGLLLERLEKQTKRLCKQPKEPEGRTSPVAEWSGEERK